MPRADLRLAQLGAADALVTVGINEERVEGVVAVEGYEDVLISRRLVPQEFEHLQHCHFWFCLYVTPIWLLPLPPYPEIPL